MNLTKNSTKEEIMAEWVRRLRSGDFPQTKRVLRNAAGFCCLGVLCEVAVDAGVIPPAIEEGARYIYGGSDAVLPPLVRQWAGLSPAGAFDDGMDHHTLTYQNDEGKSFSEIADIIENNKFLEG